MAFVICVPISFLITYVCIRLISNLVLKSVLFAKISVSMVMGIFLSESTELVDGSAFLNYLACVLLLLGFVYFLSLFPRIDMALQFMCMNMIYIILLAFVWAIVYLLLGKLIGVPEVSLGFEVMFKLFCLGSAINTISKWEKKDMAIVLSNPFLIFIERLFAAIIYMCSIRIVMISQYDNWEASALLTVLACLAGIIYFILDIMLAKTNLKRYV